MISKVQPLERRLCNYVKRSRGKYLSLIHIYIRPEIDDSEATKEFLDRKYKESVKDSVPLDRSLVKVLEEYQDVSGQLKVMEKRKTGLSNQLKAALGEHERCV